MGRRKKKRTHETYEVVGERFTSEPESVRETYYDDYAINYDDNYYIYPHSYGEARRELYEEPIEQQIRFQKRKRPRRNIYQEPDAWDEINEQLNKHGVHARLKRKKRTRCQNNKAARRAAAFAAGVAGIRNPLPKKFRRKHRC